jgi:glycogen debranching enzyme
LKVYPNDHATVRRFLDGFEPHLSEAGIGSISEVFDAEPPFTPRGCIAQAWSCGGSAALPGKNRRRAGMKI